MGWHIPPTQLAVIVPLAVVSVDITRRLILDRIERKGYPLPPGPTPLPFLGNVLSINTEEPFRTYTEWRATYGDIMYMRVLGVDVIVLNSPSVAVDLLEKRSQIYSDRPYLETVDLYGQDCNFAFTQYGELWRLCRRIFHQTFRADAIADFRPIQIRKARELIVSMVDDPSDYMFHYSTFSAGMSMRTIYNYDPKPRNDPMVSTINHFLEASLPEATIEKSVLFKIFPFLSRIPDWLPGSSIKHGARRAREMGIKTVEEPYQYVQRRMGSKEDANTSMVSNHIAIMDKLDDASYRSQYELALKRASTTAFIASVETTSSALMTFTLAMVRNPRIWKRAQADINAVVGTGRLPEFDDRSSLPYVDAIMRETLRWQPPVPLGVPHATTTSDIYNGFYIPKGATIVGNAWAMSRDETRYPRPEEFIPERFLDAAGNLTGDTPNFVFGFGRRICPGRYAVDASLWIAMATMLATLDFNYAKDADGRAIDFEAEFMNGLTRRPWAFPCCISPLPHVNKAFLERT